jgi:hypothetical protein
MSTCGQCLLRDKLVNPDVSKNMISFRGQASWAKMMSPGPNVIKLFTAVIYCHSMVIPSSCVIKQHYLGNYCRMPVNYHRNIFNIEFTLE